MMEERLLLNTDELLIPPGRRRQEVVKTKHLK